MNSGIYKITHLDSGRIYIGQSINLKNRMKSYKSAVKNNGKSHIVGALKKYGWEAFEFTVLVYAEGKEFLNLLEKQAIEVYNSMNPNGFNLREGGNDSTFTIETRKKMSEVRRAYLKDPKVIENLRSKRKNQVLSKESYEKSAAKQRQMKWMNNGIVASKVLPQDIEAKLADGFVFGRLTTYITQEYKDKQSKITKEYWNNR